MPSLEGQDSRPVPLSHRLHSLQTELAALEAELADPSNPLLQKEREEDNVDAGELFRGLVDVRTRLDRIKKGKEGRARLVNVVLEGEALLSEKLVPKTMEHEARRDADSTKTESQAIVEVDHRVEVMESIIGSSTATLDEVRHSLLPLSLHKSNYLLDVAASSTFAAINYAS